MKHSSGLVQAISLVSGHHPHQVAQKTVQYVIVRIVPTKAWSADHSHQLRQAVHEFFESPIQMDLEILERLARPHRGKPQSMICEVPLWHSKIQLPHSKPMGMTSNLVAPRKCLFRNEYCLLYR